MKLLDTDICIHLLNERERDLIDRLRSYQPLELGIPSIVLAELLWGARKSRRVAENLARVRAFAEPLQVFPLDEASAEDYGLNRASLESWGQPIGPNDTLIAAVARARGAVLVTRNIRAFSRVPGLEVEQW
ncbi:MAG: type II toxin-antitoxin system VapC family toxin [Halorhodospira sp.]